MLLYGLFLAPSFCFFFVQNIYVNLVEKRQITEKFHKFTRKNVSNVIVKEKLQKNGYCTITVFAHLLLLPVNQIPVIG